MRRCLFLLPFCLALASGAARAQDFYEALAAAYESNPTLLVGRLLDHAARVGLLFVSESSERRFLSMTLDDFPTKGEFEKLTRLELVELLERATPATE